MRILYQNMRQFRINFWNRRHWKRISETNLKSRWKWTEMVKLKEDKRVGQNFIELKHMAAVILLNYSKTKEMLKNCEAKWLGCVLTLSTYRGREQHKKGREAREKGTGSGRAGYGRREFLTSLSSPPPPFPSLVCRLYLPILFSPMPAVYKRGNKDNLSCQKWWMNLELAMNSSHGIVIDKIDLEMRK